jgi:DnaJ-class molecular chaperone
MSTTEETIKKIDSKIQERLSSAIVKDEITIPKINGNKLEELSNESDQINFLISIMNKGAKKFKETEGKPMTYSEMREIYG